MNSYLLLLGAIAFEVVGTLLLPASQGFNKLVPSVLVVCSYGASFLFPFNLGADTSSSYRLRLMGWFGRFLYCSIECNFLSADFELADCAGLVPHCYRRDSGKYL